MQSCMQFIGDTIITYSNKRQNNEKRTQLNTDLIHGAKICKMLSKLKMETCLCDGLEVPDWLHLVDHTGGLGFTVGATLGHWAFATTTTHGNAIDDVS